MNINLEIILGEWANPDTKKPDADLWVFSFSPALHSSIYNVGT